MANNTIKQGVLFKGLSKKNIVAQFDQEHASSDGGAVLLKALDDRLKTEQYACGVFIGYTTAVQGLAFAARAFPATYVQYRLRL